MSLSVRRTRTVPRQVALGLVLATVLYLVGPAVLGALDSVSNPGAYCSGFVEDTGIIGTVTDEGTADPVEGAWVAVLRASDYQVAGGAGANENGAFEAVVPAGSYYLYLIDPSGQRPAGFWGAPETITVGDGEVVNVDVTMTPTRGSFAGTVTEQGTGDPIPNAVVVTIGGPTTNFEVARVADGEGAYRVPGMTPGNHYVGFVDPTGAHVTNFHPASLTVPSATPLPITAGAVTPANAALPALAPIPGGEQITGQLVDAVNGEPIAYGIVSALRASDYQMARVGFTDAQGQYSLDLAAGDYKLGFVDARGLHSMEWYDGQGNTGLGLAESVTAPGEANAGLPPLTASMTGTVTDAFIGWPLSCAWVIAISASGQIAGGAVTDANGAYRIDGLAPGTYRMTFADPSGGRLQEYWDDSPDYPGATPITLAAGDIGVADAALGFLAPDNDDFADAHEITGASGTVLGTTNGATHEAGEPDHGGSDFTASVWYRWTAPATGQAWFDSCNSSNTPDLAAYTGSSLASLVPQPSPSPPTCGYGFGTGAEEISFPVTSGTTYHVAVEGPAAAGGAFGDVLLRWSIGAPPPAFSEAWEVGSFQKLAIGPSGDVYAVDTWGDRVVVFDDTGAQIDEFGTSGSGDGEFSSPTGIGIDGAGNVYVLDYGNTRVQKFDTGGNFLLEFGSFGADPGQFTSPSDLAVTPSGDVIVSDSGEARVQRFDSTGALEGQIGSPGDDPGQHQGPGALAVAPTGHVFVYDFFRGDVQKFTDAGAFVGAVGAPGSDIGQFSYVQGMAVDPVGNLYTVDVGTSRVQVFSSTGVLLSRWGGFGDDPGEFYSPSGIAIDALGAVYVADEGTGRIQVFEP